MDVVQELLEEAIRGIGWGILRVITLGRYKGTTPADRLAEGALGFAAVLAAMLFGYALAV